MNAGGAGFSVQGLISLVVRAQGVDQVTAGLRGLEAQAKSAGAMLARAGEGLRSFGASTAAVGRNLALGVTAPIVGLGAIALNAASDLNEAGSAVDTVFGAAASTVQDFAKTTADALGISRSEALTTASQLGALFTGIGFGTDQAADFSKNIITAAGDLASFYNIDPGTALEALRSGLIGEFDPLQRYGINITAAIVQQKALAQTGKATAESLTQQEKAFAAYTLIIEGMGAAQGDAERTADSFSNRIRRLKAQLADAAAIIGQDLLPMAQRFAATMLRLVQRFQQVSPGMRRFILIAAAIAAAIGPALIVLGAMAGGLGVLATAFGILLGPIGLALAAVAGLAIVFRGPLFRAIKGVVTALRPLAFAFKAAFESGLGIDKIVATLPLGLQALARPILLVADALGDLYAAFRAGGIGQFMAALGEEADQVGQGLRGLAGSALDLLIDGLQALAGIALDAAISGLGRLADGLVQLPGVILSALSGVDWGNVAAGAWAGIVTAFDGIDWSALAGRVSAMLAGLWDGIDWGTVGDTIWAGLQGAFSFVETAGSWLGERGAEIIAAVWNGIDWDATAAAIWAGIQDAISTAVNLGIAAGTFLADEGLTLIKGLWALDWDAIAGDIWNGVWVALQAVKTLGPVTLDAIVELAGDLKALRDDASTWLKNALNWTGTKTVSGAKVLVNGNVDFQGNTDDDGGIFDKILGFAADLPGMLASAVRAAFEAGTELADLAAFIAGKLADGLVYAVQNIDAEHIEAIAKGIVAALAAVAVLETFTALPVLLAGSFVAGFVTGIVERLAGATEPLVGAFQSIGAAIVNGMSFGFGAQWAQFIGYVYALIARLPAFVRRLLGISSPSKVFADIGRNTAAGFFAGFADQWRDGVGGARSLIDALTDGTPTGGSLAAVTRPTTPLSASLAGGGAGARPITVNARYDLGGIHGTNSDEISAELFRRLESANDRLIAQIAGAM